MNFEIISGFRKNSNLLYVLDQKMIYVKKSVYNSVAKYECRRDGCKARITVDAEGKCELAKHYVEHNHDNEEEQYKELKALNDIKSDCQNLAGTLGGDTTAMSSIRSSFRKVCESAQDDTKNISFPKIQRNLQYIVSKNLITSPKNALQVIESFNLENIWSAFGISKDEANPKHFFTACIVEDDFTFCLFSSHKTIELVKENIQPAQRRYLMDATFKIVPKGCFKQLLVIYIEYFEEIFPMFFILMDKKTERIYNSLFQYIKENVFDLDPAIFVTDYEQAMRKSICNVFPRTKTVGCWFHFCQAIRRNMCKRKTLLQYIRSSKQAALLYHKLMALALLPPDLIRTAFLEIKSKILLMDGQRHFAVFLKYFETQWMNQIGCKNFSVFDQKIRTTSAVEAYNGVLGRFAEKNGHFLKFVNLIRNEEFFKSRHLAMLCESGGALAQKRRKRNKFAKLSKIENSSKLLQEGNLTVSEFLSRMVNDGNEICTNMLPKEDIFKEESSGEESENEIFELPIINNDNLCVICQDKTPNTVLLPCKHLKICNECDLKLMADAVSNGLEKYNCPCCRQTAEESMQVFV